MKAKVNTLKIQGKSHTMSAYNIYSVEYYMSKLDANP